MAIATAIRIAAVTHTFQLVWNVFIGSPPARSTGQEARQFKQGRHLAALVSIPTDHALARLDQPNLAREAFRVDETERLRAGDRNRRGPLGTVRKRIGALVRCRAL